MDTFQSELGVKFEHTLEANHVISDKQVWVGCLGSGPNNVPLLSTYKYTEQLTYQDEVGRVVLDICRTMPYGVLLFVPSYSLLNKLLTRWNETDCSKKIKDYKEIFSETRVSKGFDTMLKDYYSCIDNSEGGQYNNGALMLAVYRGRASEGLDFSDNYARAVIAVGIPYPSFKDVQVDLKRKYNNSLCRSKNLLNGDDWYEIQAYRAINQGLGRCIRHRKDWGAIILVDERFFKNPQRYMKGVSKWIRNKFNTFPNYKSALSSLKEFNEELRNFDRDALLTGSSQDEQSQLPSQSSISQVSQAHKENSPEQNQSAYVPPVNPIRVKLEQFECGKAKKNYLTDSNYSTPSNKNTPLRPVKLERKDPSTPHVMSSIKSEKKNYSTPNLASSVGKKRKSDFANDYTDLTSDSPDIAAKKSFFGIAQKNNVSAIDMESEMETECTVIDESIEEIKIKVEKSVKIVPDSPIVPDPPIIEELNCIHCKHFICDFSTSHTLYFKDMQQLPDDLRSNIQQMGLTRLSMINSDLDQIAFDSNSKHKRFSFFMDNKNAMKLNLNSVVYLENCWQYFECPECVKIIAFVLRFSNSKDGKWVKKYLDKIVLIKDFE